MPRCAASATGLDVALDVLRHDHRRFVLADLDGRQAPIELAELADRTTSWERRRPASGDRPDRELIELQLHHRHLPRLDAVDLLAYRPADATVVECPAIGLPDDWLDERSVEAVLEALATE